MEVLLVDDNLDYLMLMKELLYANGYTVLTATDGRQGCEILSNSDVDLIISDIKMPGFDGIKLHAFARELEQYKRTKFIFLSGYKDVYSSVVNLEPEIDFFLDKSTPASEIIKFVNEQLFGKFVGMWV